MSLPTPAVWHVALATVAALQVGFVLGAWWASLASRQKNADDDATTRAHRAWSNGVAFGMDLNRRPTGREQGWTVAAISPEDVAGSIKR